MKYFIVFVGVLGSATLIPLAVLALPMFVAVFVILIIVVGPWAWLGQLLQDRDAIELSVRDYHYALDRNSPEYTAHYAMSEIESVLGMPWVRDRETDRRRDEWLLERNRFKGS